MAWWDEEREEWVDDPWEPAADDPWSPEQERLAQRVRERMSAPPDWRPEPEPYDYYRDLENDQSAWAGQSGYEPPSRGIFGSSLLGPPPGGGVQSRSFGMGQTADRYKGGFGSMFGEMPEEETRYGGGETLGGFELPAQDIWGQMEADESGREGIPDPRVAQYQAARMRGAPDWMLEEIRTGEREGG